jgi:hypothetical protein
MRNRSGFSDIVAVRVPKDWRSALDRAASDQFLSPSCYLRIALAERLQRDGHRLGPASRPSSKATGRAVVTDLAPMELPDA